MDWQRLLFDPQQQWIVRFEKLARRRLIDVNLADQAVEHALAKMQENEWARLKQFQGLSAPEAFLLCVFRHLLEDFAIARFGKCRAPKWLQQLGLRWTTLYKRLCCERRGIESIVSRESSAEEASCREICRVIKAKIPQCGSQIKFESLEASQEENNEVEASTSVSHTPEQWHQQQLCDDVTDALSRLLQGDDRAAPKFKADIFADLNIDIDTRLLLKMIYQDDVSLPKAAAILGIAEHNARRQLKRSMAQIEERLKIAGYDWNDWSAQHD